MRRPMSVAACVRALLLSLLLILCAVPAAQAQAQAEPEFRALVFSETAAFRHSSIPAGIAMFERLAEQENFEVVASEDSTIFNDEALAGFDAIVMLQASGDPWTTAEKAALERYQQAGGGIVAIHNAADMRGDYQWWDDLIGALMPQHSSNNEVGTLKVADRKHPSTRNLPSSFDFPEEWYNFDRNVRGGAHVLATVDESTYDPGPAAMGADHPISWCKPYDGGRAWVTAMGHNDAAFSDANFTEHVLGGLKWAAGVEAGECGGTIWENYEKVTLDSNTSAPFELEVAPDGRVFYTEIALGEIRMYNPQTNSTSVAGELDVYTGGEDGLLGIALDPEFEQNQWVYIYYSPASQDDADPANWINRLSRFKLDGNQLDMGSETVVMDVPAHRQASSEPGHTGGGLEFGPDGNLYLSVGDDTRPFESDGRTPIDERPGRVLWDAQRTSGNTNDLRGKLLRIAPTDTEQGGYTIPAGNLFAPGTMGTRPEIYAMGFRNPFRFKLDPETGWISLADYAADASGDDPDRGPGATMEWNLVKAPGNYGWPYCVGANTPYNDYDFATGQSGPKFDCANPVNESPNNTGLTELPPSVPADIWYPYGSSQRFPEMGSGGGAPMGGPFYRYDPELDSDTKFPEYFDGTPFFMEWSRNYVKELRLGDDGELMKINPFMPGTEFLSPMDMQFGPEGSMYMLDWGGGFGRDNPSSSLYRIDYTQGNRSPVAQAAANPDSGSAPLQVTFSSAGSTDPEGGAISFAWDFGDGTTSTEPDPTHTYPTNGQYNAQLTVTDPEGKTGTTNVPIVVGNTRPQVAFDTPPDGGFFTFGDELAWKASVTDAEDGSTAGGDIACADVVVQPSLGHDEHAHYEAQYPCEGSVETGFGGHEADANLTYVLNAEYTDDGGSGVGPLTGRRTVQLQPKRKQAENATGATAMDELESGDPEGGGDALANLGGGTWARFDPVNFTGIDSIDFRVASSAAGGTIELRSGSPDGELLGTVAVPATGGPRRWTDVTIDAPETTETIALYLVFTGDANFRLNFFEVNGKGISPATRPEVRVTAPTDNQAVDPGAVTLSADAEDAENAISKVEFLVDGELVGTDTEAPYSVTWNQSAEDYYTVRAVATNDLGLTGESRAVPFTVGDIGVKPPWTTFSNTSPEATFDQLGDNFTVSAAGADLWQGSNDYGAVYLPGGAPENFAATVKVASFDGTHPASKAGIMVRNDISQSGSSPGYMVLSEKGNGETEFMHDADGNGQVNNTGEPVATACPGDQPTWLKVTKFGKAFSAYCSKNGTDWTQVGLTTEIPAATTTQDIGLFVVSHIAGTKATAEFTDWAIDTDPELPDPDPDPSEPAPSCAGGASDEFDGPLSDARWTVVRGAAGQAPATSDGSLVLPVTQGDIDGGNTGPISYAGQPVPDGDWQIETKITLDPDNEWQHAGLAQVVDDDNYVKFAATMNSAGTRFLEFQTETGGSRSWHGPNVNLPAGTPTTLYMRLTRTGSTLAAAYSTDGTTWTNWTATATLKAGGTVGVVAAGDTDAQNKSAAVDYFRVSPDELPEAPGPNDEFEGSELDGCRWDGIVNYNSNRLDVADGKLSIETFDADISGADNGDIENLILQSPPEGDWTVETKMTAPLGDAWQLAGLMLYGDDDHYVKYDVVADNEPGAAPVRRVELRYEDGGGLTGPGGQDPVPPASPTDTWWLRLTKTGDTYTGQISVDGETWQQTPGSVTVALDDPSIGLMAIGPQQDEPITVDFEYFRVLEDEPENTAPTVTAAADPASGDAPLPVAFTATGEDADDDELTYSWDFDGDGSEDSTEQNPSRTYEEAGTYTATVTVEDPDGAVGTDEVEITVTEAADPEAPTVQAFASQDSGESPLRVRFTSTALDPEGGRLDYAWEFGNGDRAFTRNATYTYAEAGTYTAKLTVTDEQGKTASDEIEITVTEPVNAEPTVEATADVTSGGSPLRVRFGATGADEEDPAGELSYAWDFGDGGSSVARNPLHVYRTPGTHTATVTVTDGEGATGTDTVEITVTNAAPTVEAAASPRSGTAPLRVRLSSQGADADGDRLTYAWETGDGGTADTRSAWHTYTEPGTYEATVTVTDAYGQTGTASVEITVSEPANGAPTVRMAADPKTGAAPLRVRFSSAASDPDRDPLSSVWDFGDGGRAGGTGATHTYTRPGTYQATVTVTDPGGETGTATIGIVVTGPPAVAQAAPQPAAPAPAQQGGVAGETGSSPLVALRRSAKVRRVARRGLRYKVSCERACRVASVLRLEGRRIGHAKARSVRAGGSRTIVLRLDRKVRRKLAAAMRSAGLKRVEATVVTKVRTADGTERLRDRVVLKR